MKEGGILMGRDCICHKRNTYSNKHTTEKREREIEVNPVP